MPTVVDTRTEPDLSCADQTNSAYDALGVGESLEIVADHDPQPLYFMLRAERGETFTWDLVESGPQLWRARVRRTDG
jgi:regulator of cell morphogenesis and NO signaling